MNWLINTNVGRLIGISTLALLFYIIAYILDMYNYHGFIMLFCMIMAAFGLVACIAQFLYWTVTGLIINPIKKLLKIKQ